MNEKDILHLIHRRIDGELSEKEKKTLDRELEAHPDMRRQSESISQTVAEIEQFPQLDPPATLISDVLGRIDTKRYSKVHSFPDQFIIKIKNFIAPRRQVAFAFVSGIILGAVFFGLLAQYETAPTSDISGTIGVIHDGSPRHYFLESSHLTCDFSLEVSSGNIICSADVTTNHPYTMQLRTNSNNHFLTNYGTQSEIPVFIESKPGEIVVKGTSPAKIRLVLSASVMTADQVFLQFSCEDQIVNKTILLK